MVRRSFAREALFCFAAVSLAWFWSARDADAAAPYYAGKQIRLVVGSGAGGGLDVYARTLATYLAAHIPGKPAVVVEDMPGAIGVVAMNWLAHDAPQDGTALLASSNVALAAPLFGSRAAKYDPRKLQAIGSVAKQHSVCATWGASPVKTIAQAKTHPVVVAADAAASRSATIPKMLNAMIGTKFRVVTGYATTDVGMALERGEADGVCLSWSTLKAAHPDWVRNHRLNVLIQTGATPQRDLADVPALGALVSNPQDKQILDVLGFPDEVGRPYLTAPNAPPAAVAALRSAFDATMRDQGFLADARRAMLDVDPLTGEEMARMIAAAYAAPPAIVAKAAPFSGMGK